MDQVLNNRLLNILQKPLEGVKATTKLEKAYGELVEEVKHLHQSVNSYSTIIRTLNLIRIEFVALQTFLQYGQEKKMRLKTCISKKRLFSWTKNWR